MINITHVRMSQPGSGHEHIVRVKWVEVGGSGGAGENTRQQMVEWIEGGGVAVVRRPGVPEARVGVVDATPKYIQTYADGRWNNNLLSLPRF